LIPLTTLQGLPPAEIRALTASRPVHIWGAGDVGLDVLTSLQRSGVEVSGFLHTQPAPGATYRGLPVRPVEQVLNADARKAGVFVVIASAQFLKTAEARCREAGLEAQRDYLSYLALRRPVAVIEVASRPGAAAPYGSFVAAPDADKALSLEEFQRALARVEQDQPCLCHVELSWLGDPLWNPELAQIVAHCERTTPCTVTTTLPHTDGLEALLAAGPSRFNLLAYGYGAGYEAQMGVAWSDFLARLERLKQVVRNNVGRTRFLLRYQQTAGDDAAAAEQWRALLAGSGIGLSVEVPYLMPYDPLLDHAAGAPLAPPVQQAVARLTWQLQATLDLSRQDRDHPCLSQRVFPVVGADLSVGVCHLYQEPRLAADYMNCSWDSLVEQRAESAQCTRCQEHGLHRLDLAVLTRRYPTIAPKLFKD
jgi:hypothetical protein